jgi:hypothetical protein
LSASNVGRAGSAMRSASRMGQESQDVERAEENIEVLKARLADLEREAQGAAASLETQFDAAGVPLRQVDVPARKSDIAIGEVALVWTPWRTGADGFPAPAYE